MQDGKSTKGEGEVVLPGRNVKKNNFQGKYHSPGVLKKGGGKCLTRKGRGVWEHLLKRGGSWVSHKKITCSKNDK